MSQRPPPLHDPYRDFQGPIDAALRKDDPAASVPWTATPIPAWAKGFAPRTILDIGCARGRFTCAALARLGDWGCLSRLESLLLVEDDWSVDANGEPAREATIRRCWRVLERYKRPGVSVRLLDEQAAVQQVATGTSKIWVGEARLAPSDLVLLSHVTYYFDGQGASLIRAMGSWLNPGSLAWIVVRKAQCPIYEKRLAYLRANLRVSEGGYAEQIEDVIRQSDGLKLLEARDCDFLARDRRPGDCVSLAHLLMWRAPAGQNDPTQVRLAQEVCSDPRPLLSERHFIAQASGPGALADFGQSRN